MALGHPDDHEHPCRWIHRGTCPPVVRRLRQPRSGEVHRAVEVSGRRSRTSPSGLFRRARAVATIDPMSGRVTSPVFVGRRAELAGLRRRSRRPPTASPSMTLVDGEAGIGKSRLIAELVARMSRWGRPRRAAGEVGRARALRSSSPAAASRSARAGCRSAPIVEVAPLARRAGPAARSCTTRSGRRRPSSPGSSPSCPTDPSPRPSPFQAGDWLQARIFEGFLGLLGRLGESSTGRPRHRGPPLGRTRRPGTCSRSWRATCGPNDWRSSRRSGPTTSSAATRSWPGWPRWSDCRGSSGSR